jgi:hypothetical protein
MDLCKKDQFSYYQSMEGTVQDQIEEEPPLVCLLSFPWSAVKDINPHLVFFSQTFVQLSASCQDI